MGASKKHAKGRLDKYYHMAKEQGYRARSAFKLIQLNKKYNFLEKAKVTVDLCAAPGGWCQVAQKYMPKPSIIIGLDLAPIKPIPGVITHVEDITTAKCRATLKKELKTWKADVFLHDGAPNVGISWIQDAFSQSELVLAALKLATEFLIQGGTFVTKVFRSKDYNKLMWVFNQLFEKVGATKPTASRNVSAEIFVVCQGYYAPKKIDPKLLDPKHAFKEVDDVDHQDELDPKKIKEQQGQVMNDLFHPEKRRRHRDGYQDGDYTLYATNDVAEFVKSIDFLGILSRSSALVFGNDEFSQQLKNHSSTDEEILEYFSDLKVLGKKEFKTIIRWRDNIRIATGLVVPSEEKEPEKVEEKELSLEELLEKERSDLEHAKKKEKKKQRERKAKTLMKMQLGMDTPTDIGIEGASLSALAPDLDMGEPEASKKRKLDSDSEQESELSVYESDDERVRKISRLDQEMNEMYEQYKERQINKNALEKVKKIKESEGVKAQFEEWYGIADDENTLKASEDTSSDSDSDDEEEEEGKELSSNAKMFFDNPIFSMADSSLFENELTIKKSKESVMRKFQEEEEEEKSANDFQVVPLRNEDDDDDEDPTTLDNPAAITMALKMMRNSSKRELIDDAFNKYAHNDPEGLPEWFLNDENKHNKPSKPVTKEAVKIYQERMKQINARPIKKVAEAKFRKQMRAQRRLEKSLAKADHLADNQDVPEKQKLEEIERLMAKAKKTPKGERKKPTLVVAKGVNRGTQGRPRGVKGRYKMVDSRMKKEVRAEKRKQKRRK